jgi:hypothetical protein
VAVDVGRICAVGARSTAREDSLILHCLIQTGKFHSVFPLASTIKKGKGLRADGKEKQKRTISAYNLFIRYEIEDMKANNLIPPDSKITDTIRGLGQVWTNMEANAKASKSKLLFLRHQKDHPEFVIPADIMAALDEVRLFCFAFCEPVQARCDRNGGYHYICSPLLPFVRSSPRKRQRRRRPSRFRCVYLHVLCIVDQ